MAKTVSVIGVDPGELRWLRMLLFLLRHPDPVMSQLVRQALLYLEKNTQQCAQPAVEPLDHTG
jgi:hypothetical protein